MELLAIFLVIPLGLYFLHERGRGRGWGLVASGEETRGTGAYRATRVRTWKRGAAPPSVRIAAITSFFLGQMIVPGALAALVGLVAVAEVLSRGQGPALLVILELSAPTGLLVAAHLLAAGNAMLARDDDAAKKARTASRWALGHNAALLVALLVGALIDGREGHWAILPALYCLASIGHALIVRHAASAIDAYTEQQREDPAPSEAVSDVDPTR